MTARAYRHFLEANGSTGSKAAKRTCAALIEEAHAAGRKVGICSQAPPDYPDFTTLLVEKGVDSISLRPDAVVPTTLRALEEEGRGR